MRSWAFYARQVFYYAILFVILREWLVPIIELTSTAYLSLFLIFIGICFLFNILQLKFYVSWPLKIIYIAWIAAYIYGDASLFSKDGIAFLVNDFGVNLNALATMDFKEFTNSLRTSLFFVLIWMLCYLLQHWLMVKRSIFYFLALTVFFVATIDTFTKYDGSRGVMVSLVLGLILTAVLYVEKLMKAHETKLTLKDYAKYITPIVCVIAIVGAISFVLPKAGPQWPDPVPFVKSLAGGASSGEVSQKVGIDDDDSQLGGSFVGDDTVVYEIISKDPQYWRVEMKTIYDSKGWQSDKVWMEGYDLEGFSNLFSPEDLENDVIAEIHSNNENTFIINPYGMHSFDHSLANARFVIDYATERITSFVDSDMIPLDSYVIGYTVPEYSYTTLKKPMSEGELTFTVDNSNYVQIPDTMPQRVRDLAVEITDSYDSVYDKAKAIERYFKSKGFVYRTKDVAIPVEGQDYVDQFLFETKVGYCDNFSTSMVMLLRSVGIPARWVKGYAEGTKTGKTVEGQNIYEVTNNDAHSWVEAYVPDIGWMPFEPTIGFSQNYDIDFDMELETDTPAADEVVKEQQQLQKEREEAKDIKKATAKKASNPKWGIIFTVLGVIIAALLLWFTRSKWQQLLPNAKPTTVKGAYRHLEKRLAKLGLIRKQGETLRAFATRVDNLLETNEMTKFISIYEQSLYSSNNAANFLEIKESYEYLINRLDG